jgi:hypothetical protein
MKPYSVLLAFTMFFVGCSRSGPSLECKEKATEFQKLTSGYFRGCIQTCFKASGKLAPSKTEEAKIICDQECRQTIPFIEINKMKETINSVYNCNLDYKRAL